MPPFQRTTEFVMKLVPVRESVNDGRPTVAWPGLTAAIAGAGFGVTAS